MKAEQKRALATVLVIFLATVTGLEIWMHIVRLLFPALPPTFNPDLYRGTAPEGNSWLEPWQRWDTPQYQAIAERGYAAFDTAYFTPPLFPWLMRWSAWIFGGNTLAAGLFVSAMAFLASLMTLYWLACYELENDQDALRAVLYLAFFPTAFFLVAAYSESLFLLAAMNSLYNARRSRWLPAGVWGGMAALSRLSGAFLLVPLLYAAWQALKTGDRRGWQAPFVASLGAAFYPLYVWIGLNQRPLIILKAQYARGGKLFVPGWNLMVAAVRIAQGHLVEENLIELSFTVLFIILSVFIWKKLPRLYGIYTLTLLLFFLARLGSPQPLVSMGRYVLEIFPAFLVLACWGRKAWAQRLILYVFWSGWLFFSAQFAMWGWVR